METDWALVGRRVARLRQQQGIDRRALAERASIPYFNVKMIERGAGLSLRDDVEAVAVALGTDNAELTKPKGGQADEPTPDEAGLVSGVGD